eukprot:1735142-Amphidinium_carterae.1
MVHGMVLRRESMTCLNRSWRLLARPEGVPLPLPEIVKREWLIAVLHLPLLQVNLRARVSPVVLASDASETGGGACATVKLSELGLAALGTPAVLHPGRARDSLLLVTIHDE